MPGSGRDAGKRALARAPAALLLGPRQCGKSTLARQLLVQRDDAVILDLQDRADRARLQEPELFFEAHRHQLVCLDESFTCATAACCTICWASRSTTICWPIRRPARAGRAS